MRIDEFMQSWDLRDVNHVVVAAEVQSVWRALQEFDLNRDPLVRMLFELSDGPTHHKRTDHADGVVVGSIAWGQTGFVTLEQQPGQEILYGAIGKFWQTGSPFVPVAPDEFVSFRQPGYAKMAISLRLHPVPGAATYLVVDVRVTTTDEEARRSFDRYWLLIGRLSRLILQRAVSTLEREVTGFGDGSAENLRLPGDALLEDESLQKTHDVFVEATPDEVWPWVEQMARERAGWYNREVLGDRAPRRGVLGSDSLHLETGDRIPCGPDRRRGLRVVGIQKPSYLVLEGFEDLQTHQLVPFDEPNPNAFWHVTWTFALQPFPEGMTRVISRLRVEFAPKRWGGLAADLFTIPAYDRIEQRSLETIRSRVEGTAMHRSRPTGT